MPKKVLISFFAIEEDGSCKMAGIGLTDEIIEDLKKQKAFFEDRDRTGAPLDLMITYAPTEKELLHMLQDIMPNGINGKVKIV